MILVDWLLPNRPLAQFVLGGTIVFVAGWVVGSIVMGLYLLISLNVFGRHSEEAFSALKIQDYKHFLRLHVKADGTLTIYPIKIDRVPRAVARPRDERDDTPSHIVPAEPLVAELIEPPIVIRAAQSAGSRSQAESTTPTRSGRSVRQQAATGDRSGPARTGESHRSRLDSARAASKSGLLPRQPGCAHLRGTQGHRRQDVWRGRRPAPSFFAPFANRIRLAFIYGSLARAEDIAARSDIDVMIVGDVMLSELANALHDAETRLRRPITPTIYEEAEFRDRVQAGQHFLSQVLKRPKVFLVADEHELHRLAQSAA